MDRRLLSAAAAAALVASAVAIAPVEAADPAFSLGGRVAGNVCLNHVVINLIGLKTCEEQDEGYSFKAAQLDTPLVAHLSQHRAGKTKAGTAASGTAAEDATLTVTKSATGGFETLEIDGDLRESVKGDNGVDAGINVYGSFENTQSTLYVTGELTYQLAGEEARTHPKYAAVTAVIFQVDAKCPGPAGLSQPPPINVLVRAGGPSPARVAATTKIEEELPLKSGSCGLSLFVDVSAGAVGTGAPVPTATGSGNLKVKLKLSTKPPTCDLQGTIRDGGDSDEHANPLPGVLVELFKDGKATGTRSATDDTGIYCLRGAKPDDYEIRASLTDAAHNPPIFKTVKFGTTGVVTAKGTVAKDDFGRDDFDIDFRPTNAEPNLADMANMHWQVTRYVDWLITNARIDPGRLGSFTLQPFETSTAPTAGRDPTAGAHYNGGVVYIGSKISTYASRSSGLSKCPENCEWHEVTHHLESALGVLKVCPGDKNHAGWTNPTTCDSLQEGFAEFLPTLASLAIDAANPEPDYATSVYASNIADLEANGWKPWSYLDIGSTAQREELAAAQHFWDLIDESSADPEPISVVDPAKPGSAATYTAADDVFLPIRDLIDTIGTLKTPAVADLHDALVRSAFVATAFKQPTNDANGDGTPDISPLDDLFLMHGFHTVPDPLKASYQLGDPIGVTDRPGTDGTSLTSRHGIDEIEGSAIRLSNGTSAAAEFTVDVVDGAITTHLRVPVAAQTERILHLELPPYWVGLVKPGQALPACGAPGERKLSVTISGAGQSQLLTDGCQYLGAVAKAAGAEFAISYGPTVASPAPSASPAAPAGGGSADPPIAAIAVVLIVLVAVLIGAFGWRRRRGGSGSPT